jgi:hypothetical protein
MDQEILISLGISHTPWRPERVASFRNRDNQLKVFVCSMEAFQKPSGTIAKLFADKAPNYVWSSDMWSWAASTEATHCLFLQDDVIVAPNFWPALRAMLQAVPDQIIGLESVHPYSMTLARSGGRWYTTTDGLIGVGYVMPRNVLVEFLAWRGQLRKGAVEAITEDTLIDVFAMSTGRRIWHPVPTIIDHDTTLDSTYGNDHHSYRKPVVKWSDADVLGFKPEELEQVEFWNPTQLLMLKNGKSVGVNPPHFGRFYAGTHWLAKQWDKSWDAAKHDRLEKDITPEVYSKWL